MKHQLILFLFLATFVLNSCISSRKATTDIKPSASKVEAKIPEPANYQATVTKSHNLIHTKLEVSFDWDNRQLMGTAEITLKPHFYSTNMLFLDARGMEINEVKIFKGDKKDELAYVYRNDSICITLDKYYSRQDTFKVYIDYVAKPEGLPKGGSSAISSDKGLYFINADGSDPIKPQQIWTQGETQSSSVWFPTIDRPNQKTTQEIYITVDTSFVTLSNGVLVSSIVNTASGLRTDYWRQTLPHTPYLFMMAVGKYAVVREKWKNIEVSYYVEPEYEQYAKLIFNHTPEMLEFFSNKLGVDYPWEKYAQVVVRDFVSGAMENTTATIYGEFVQKDDRALLDATNDDIVAHELFHHWFGDLVTCESWSNLVLNESFATYGEYLWNEYKYGRDEADWALQNDLKSYLQEARSKQVNLVRFDYNDHMEMFDRHSYQKGGRVLHMLRKYVGDEAFFASLNRYLENMKFDAAEIHDLRLAFEKVTGEDMNWFFNQWFLDKGHPSLKIEYEFDSENNNQLVKVQQMQSFETTPLYKIPVDIDIYTNDGVERKRVVINMQSEVFSFNVKSKPQLVNFDADKMLLSTKSDNHTNEEWIAMFKRAPLFLDRYEALNSLMKDYKPGTPEAEVVKLALNDPHWNIRMLAIKNSKGLIKSDAEEMKQKLIKMAETDSNSSVRNEALEALADKYSKDEEVNNLMNRAINDRSYKVMSTAVLYMLETNKEEGLELVKKLENEKNENIQSMVSNFYVKYGGDEQYEFMTNAMAMSSGFSKYSAVQNYGKFLMRCAPANAQKGIDQIADVGLNHSQWFVRLAATQALAEVSKSYGKKADKPVSAETVQPGASALNERNEMEIEKVRKKAEDLVVQIKSKEEDPNLLRIYNR